MDPTLDLTPTPTQPAQPDVDSNVYLQITAMTGIAVTRIPLSDVKTLFQRALNTWPDAPKGLIELSDGLDQL